MTQNKSGSGNLKKTSLSVVAVVGVMYTMVASGAYGIEDMIPSSGPGMTILMLILLALLWGYPLSLICSELGSAIPEEGGSYVWAKKAFGEFWGFQVGFWRVIGSYVGVPTYVVLGGNYIGALLGWNETVTLIFKFALILIFAYINWRGVKEMATLSTILSIIICVAFLAVMVIGFANWNTNPVQPFIPEGQGTIMSMSVAMAIGIWMYSGYESMAIIAGELENPQVIPKALLITFPLVLLTYIPTTLAGLASVGNWQDWGTEGLSYGDVAALAAPWMQYAFVIVAFIGQIAMFNSFLGNNARVIFVLSDDNMAPKVLSKVNKHGVPSVSLISFVVVSAVLCMLDFSVLATLTVTAMMLGYTVIAIAAIYFRAKCPEMKRPYKVGMPDWMFYLMCGLIPVISVIALYINGTDYFLFGALLVIAGPFIYWILKKVYGGQSEQERGKITSMNRGDFKNFAVLLLAMGILCIGGYFFLPTYEDPVYYAEAYGNGAFNIFVNCIGIIGVISAIAGLIFVRLHKKSEKLY